MYAFLTVMTAYFNEDINAVLLNALNLKYSLDDMLYILYKHTINRVDPFADRAVFYKTARSLGLGHILNSLFKLYGIIISAKHS